MIAVTGATGQLGAHVMEGLLRQVPAAQIVAAVRTPEKASAWSEQGAQVREADYFRPETLEAAFAGVEKVLLISSNDLEGRVAQHQAVIDAAVKAGVKLLAYTGILKSETSTLLLARDHQATEAAIRASGLNFVFLRNGWYIENQTATLGPALEHGAIMGAAQDGRFAAAARSDYAEAAVAVLTGEGHENRSYELAGDASYTLSDLAGVVSRQAGKPVAYHDLPREEYAAALAGFGLPSDLAGAIADADAGAARGELDSDARDLSALIGHPTVTLEDAVAAALKT